MTSTRLHKESQPTTLWMKIKSCNTYTYT